MNPQDDASSDPSNPEPSILERWPSWAWLAILVGIVGGVWLLTLINPGIFYDQFVRPYWLEPILGDEGYNAVNTVALILPLLLLLLWAYAFLKELDERVGFSLIVAVLPILVLGSVFRVLEDADLFAPYNTGDSCVLGAAGGFFETCFGILFITPIIYVLAALMTGGMLWMGHQAKRVARRYTVAKGLQYYALTLLAVVILYAAMWSYGPGSILYLHHPIWILLTAVVCYLLVHQYTRATKRIDPHAILFAYGLFVLLFGLMYVLDWMTGSPWGLGATGETRGWVWGALLVAPMLIMVATMALGRVFANRRPWGRRGPEVEGKGPAESAAAPLTALVVLLLTVSIGAFVMAVGAADAERLWRDGVPLGLSGGWLAAASKILLGPALFVLAIESARRMVGGAFPVHTKMIFYAAPINLVMVFGQMADAVMTSLGIDVYEYSEKHVLPSFLIEQVAGANLPGGLSHWAATIVMLPLKLIIVLLVVWVIDVQVQEPRKNLVGLIKLAIIMVGLSPAIRNATRLAMGT